ncbi:unnamed protein product, partial [Mesorhabditis belari]|uniref:Uncharacterized protein n=1 Tax=Mesorhabditis belari TaxID=2138241 RepID=A0AAF3J1Y3_9BILA
MALHHQVILVAFAAVFLVNDTEAVRGALIRHGRASSLSRYASQDFLRFGRSQVDDEVQPISYGRSIGLRYFRPNIIPIADDWEF